MQSTAENVPIDTLRLTFETNFFGSVDLTQRLLQLLRRSDNPRVVNQSSIVGSLTEHSDPKSVIADVHALELLHEQDGRERLHRSPCQGAPQLADQGELRPSRQCEDRLNPTGDLSVEEGARKAIERYLSDEQYQYRQFLTVGAS